ncbi:MAG: hypothetical protein ABIQ70_12000 [Dokdonella sp.]
MSRTHALSRYMRSVAFMFLFVAIPASAWVGVGAAPSCEVRTIQAAINKIMARQHNGDFSDPLVVVSGGSYNEALGIDGRDINGHVIAITGGYAADCSGPQAGSVTTINALHRNGSALTIRGSIAVSLDTLTLTGANTGGNGGGIYFDGAGSLDVTNTVINFNHASRGGGLYANGTSPGLAIRMHSQTIVQGNYALHSGGGISVQGKTRLFMLDGALVVGNSVDFNDADGAGGGLQIIGPASADIGSGRIIVNSARYGGGISAHTSNGQKSNVRFFSTLTNRPPTQIENNSATRSGGGIFVGVGGSHVCGMGWIIGNEAREGAGIYVDGGSDVALTPGPPAACGPEPATSLGALACTQGSPCTSINDNHAVAIDEYGQATDGSAVLVQTLAGFDASRVEMRRNTGKYAIRGFQTAAGVLLSMNACLLADNQTTGDLIRTEESGALLLNHCTVAGNQIGGANVLSLTGDLVLAKSLIRQNNRVTLLQNSGRSRNISDVVSIEIQSIGGSLGADAHVTNLPVDFTNPEAGDYHLLPYSAGIDFAPAFGESGTDLEGHARVVDLPLADHSLGGPVDLGAYELQVFPTFPADENFDELTAPALPFGWLDNHNDASLGWRTVASAAASSPNAAFADDPATASDKSLETSAVYIVNYGKLRFRHKMDLDASPGSGITFDGVVFEISIDQQPFTDIFAAGGSFASGGYDHLIFPSSGNPLAGRSAWGGATDGYKDVAVNLPASANGKGVRFRWRMGTDAFEAGVGYWLDDIHVDANTPFPFDQNFDHVTAPALPVGWLGADWSTITTSSASSPNAAFTDEPPFVTDRFLVTPSIQIATKGRLRFRHLMNMEEASPGSVFARDGIVLEIAIAGGPFSDIFQAGGSFVSGAYDHSLPAFSPGNNPLKGRAVWSGSTQGLYKDVVVNLPASADGNSVRLRWRLGTDETNVGSYFGYALDDVHVDAEGSLP